MINMTLLGEWDNDKNFFWFGANGNEYIAFNNASQILVYPCDDPKHRPSAIIENNEQITTIEAFSNTLQSGTTLLIDYTPAHETPEGTMKTMDFEEAFDKYKTGDSSLAVKNTILQDVYAMLEDENYHTGVEVIESLTGIPYA